MFPGHLHEIWEQNRHLLQTERPRKAVLGVQGLRSKGHCSGFTPAKTKLWERVGRTPVFNCVSSPASSPDPALAMASMCTAGKRPLQPATALSLSEPKAAAKLRLVVSSELLSFCPQGSSFPKGHLRSWRSTVCCEGAFTIGSGPWGCRNPGV